MIVSQSPYADQVEPIAVWRLRLSQVTERLTSGEIRQVQSVAGAANCLATQTRPDIAFEVSVLVGQLSHDGTVQCLKAANKLVRRIKSDRHFCLLFRKLPNTTMYALHIKAFCDGSWANMPGLRSQTGQLYTIAGTSDTEEMFEADVCHWRSQRIKRVCRSTLHAETLSATDTCDQAIFLGNMLRTWIHGDRPDAPQTRIDVLTDCHSLVDSMSQVVPTSTEKRLRLDLLAIKESLDSGGINILRWVDTRLQLGDSLTKAASDEVRQTFIHALQSGRFS